MDWVLLCDAVIVEVSVSVPLLGVGYEIGRAEKAGKPILCLYDPNSDFQLSAMLSGNPNAIVKSYKELPEAKAVISESISKKE